MSPATTRSLLRSATRFTSVAARRPMSSAKPINTGSEQAHPIGPFYEAILTSTLHPTPKTKPEEPPASATKAAKTTARKAASAQASSGEAVDAPKPAAPTPRLSAEPATAEEKARIIFGSRLAGPIERAERLQAIKDKSTMIAGVLVPPKPEEPDNCCMSGCVNCVWDRFRDEMEDWVVASAKAEQRLEAEKAKTTGPATEPVRAAGVNSGEAVSMDDDGGGSDTNWPVERPKITKDLWDEDLYKGVPVGIREFMKTEKKLKERHGKEGTIGG
ncbi:oxidoreductase-like protein [Xylariales sp. PMI_506]|nr:oxidoreductase-like protein [Xylariales sp. PMI_506]